MIVAMVVIVIAIIVIVMVMPMVIVISIVIMPVVWDVFVVVPVVLHEVDGPAASVVLRAMLTPMFFVSRRNVEVDRLGRGILRRLRNHDRLRIDHWRPWSISDVNLPVEPRLTDADGYADLGKCGGCNGGPQENCVDCFVHMSVQARSGPPLRLKSGHKVTDCNWTGAERGGIKSHVVIPAAAPVPAHWAGQAAVRKSRGEMQQCIARVETLGGIVVYSVRRATKTRRRSAVAC